MEAAEHNARYYANHDANMMRNDGINDTKIILEREAEAKARFENVSRQVTETFDREDKDYVTMGATDRDGPRSGVNSRIGCLVRFSRPQHRLVAHVVQSRHYELYVVLIDTRSPNHASTKI